MSEDKKSPATDTRDPLASRTPEVRDRRSLPEGVVSKQSQAYLIVGLSVLILLAVMFSNNRTKPTAKPSAASPTVVSTDANQRSIEELKHDLGEEQRKSEEQAQSQKPAGSGPSSSTSGGTQTTPPNYNIPAHVEPPRDPVKDAERALSFKARFASNLVSVTDTAAHPAATQSVEVANAISRQDVRAAEANAATSKHAPEVNINSAFGQPYVLFEGTTVDTALVNRLDGEFSGPVKVMVTNPVYSQDRQRVLIPEGTFILGEVQKVSGFGQKRLAVVFHRMLMPDGYSVDLDQFHGLDQVGETGLRDKVNNHYLEIFGASIALGVISGAAEATTNSGYNQSGSDMYRQGVASSLSQESAHVLDRFINVPPTITIREGHRIKVYLTQDLLLPAYENHTVPPNI